MPRSLSKVLLWRKEKECKYGSATCEMLDHEIIMIGLNGLPVNWKN